MLIRIASFILIFFISAFFISSRMSRVNTATTLEMSEATLPLVSVLYNGTEANFMHGLTYEPDLTKYRGDLSPMGDDRTINIVVKEMNAAVVGISYEVRSSDGSRLIENNDIYDYTGGDGTLNATITLKDLIKPKVEYSLCVILTLSDSRSIRYYTRVIQDPTLHTSQLVAFVNEFSSRTFNKESAKALTSYLETDSTGDNSSYAHVNIHSSFSQVTWGDLNPKRVSSPDTRILDLAGNIGSFKLTYRVTCGIDNKDSYYDISEYYRVRYSDERIYLLDFEREMNEVFTGAKASFANDKIILGIHDSDIPLAENAAGNAVAFVTGGSLYAYRSEDSRIAKVFSFVDSSNDDERTRYAAHDIKVLSVDEGGNILFVVYGYQNRGEHEGEICAVVYQYDSALNVVNEAVCVPYAGSAQMLEANIRKLSYVDRTGDFYLYLDGGLYCINVDRKSVETIASGIAFDDVASSESGKIGAYVVGGLVGAGSETDSQAPKDTISLIDMSTGTYIPVKADPGYHLNLLGFIGEDLVFGQMMPTDTITSTIGVDFTPMSSIRIVGSDGSIKKDYKPGGMYISDVDINGSTIDLSRIVASGANAGYEPAEGDQIMSSSASGSDMNRIILAATEQRENITEIQLPNDVSSSRLQLLTPDFALYEGSHEVAITTDDSTLKDSYVVYVKGEISGIYSTGYSALNEASELSGIVLDMKNNYIWRKGSREAKHIIPGLQELSGGSYETALADCLNAVLAYTGSVEDAAPLLAEGATSDNILKANIDGNVLDLRGIPLSDVLYYIYHDSPVIAAGDNGPLLIVGYDAKNTLVYDPALSQTHYIGINDSTELFARNGNEFLTYIQ